MANSTGGGEGFDTRPVSSADLGGASDGDAVSGSVLCALFDDYDAAASAVRELRDIGIPAGNISLIARKADEEIDPHNGGPAGIAREEVDEEDFTYRASNELPNDEDLPTTTAQLTGEPPDTDPRDGLTRDAGMVRRVEADPNADVDIYTDFPDQPGGVNPDSPAAARANVKATAQAPVEDREDVRRAAAAGAGLGSLAGLLVGLGVLAVPGVGPLLAAGPLAAALGGMAAGGVAGGILGALSTVGLPEEYARPYAAAIEEGSALVAVRTDEFTRDAVERVLTAHGGREIH